MNDERPELAAIAGPLSGKRVLVTRPVGQAATFADKLSARGALPILAPTIAIGPPDDSRNADDAIQDLRAFTWVAFTSSNGVDAFFERFASVGSHERALHEIRVAAIGSKTADRLRHFGVRPDLVPETYVSEEIAGALIARTSDRDRILIFGAQAARDVLPRMLAGAGRDARVVAAYKTTLATDDRFAEKVAAADVVTFASASAVDGFVTLLGGRRSAGTAAHGKTIACIGPIAAQAARRTGLTVDVVADVATSDGLIDALSTHFAHNT